MPRSQPPRKFCLYEYDKELAAAFKGDCEEFLEEYEKLRSFSYEDFATVWQLKKFTYVYAGQNYALLLRELCENYFYIVKKFIMFPKSVYTQIGAFYLLYGLYYKQPLRNWVKIRLTLEEYKKIVELIELMKSRRQHDAVYIFAKMKVDQVFLYTALLKPLGPEDRFVKSYELYYDNTFNSSRTESALYNFNEILPDCDLVKDLEKTNDEYQNGLKKYAVQCPSLSPFVSTIVDDLKQAYTRIQQGQSMQQVPPTDSKQLVKSLKASIKAKAMESKVAVYRGERKVKKGTDEELINSILDNKK